MASPAKNDVCKALEAANMKPVHVASLPLGMEDLGDKIETARSAEANVIIAHMVDPESAVIARCRAALPSNSPTLKTPDETCSYGAGRREAGRGKSHGCTQTHTKPRYLA